MNATIIYLIDRINKQINKQINNEIWKKKKINLGNVNKRKEK